MAPQPETRQAQRIELVEEAIADLRNSMREEVTTAVNRATAEVQQALITQITASLDQVTHKLQVRIDRVRENNETLISEVTRRQGKFEAEMKSTLSTLQSAHTGVLGVMARLWAQELEAVPVEVRGFLGIGTGTGMKELWEKAR